MTKSEKSLFERIGSVRNSLENAEQSFKDNQEMRGELDLMLAEAELKNLRRKKDVPWTWNRHVLAICIASMVALGGLVGWYFAIDQYQNANATDVTVPKAPDVVQNNEAQSVKEKSPSKPPVTSDNKTNLGKLSEEKVENNSQINITKNDMRRLVRSARVELSNSK